MIVINYVIISQKLNIIVCNKMIGEFKNNLVIRKLAQVIVHQVYKKPITPFIEGFSNG